MNFTTLFAAFATFLYFISTVIARSHSNRIGVQQRNYEQKRHNDEIMSKDTIGINDRIYYNKVIKTQFHELLCPYIQELLVFDESQYFIMMGYTSLENYREYLLKNVSDFYMNEIYTSRNYPTYRENVILVNVTMDDVYLYHKHQCSKYPVHKALITHYHKIVKIYHKLNESFYGNEFKTTRRNTNTIDPKNKKIPHSHHTHLNDTNYISILHPLVVLFGTFCLLNLVGGTSRKIK
jgi:hypothetical protein